MRSKRIIEGNKTIFDARELFKIDEHENQVLLEMRNGPASYTTDAGTKFWAKHPFQWVSKKEAALLLTSTAPEFREAEIGDLEDYYSYD